MLFEVKWRELNQREAYNILEELEEKGLNMPYPVKYYGLIGLKVEGLEDIRRSGYIVFELEDMTNAEYPQRRL